MILLLAFAADFKFVLNKYFELLTSLLNFRLKRYIVKRFNFLNFYSEFST